MPSIQAPSTHNTLSLPSRTATTTELSPAWNRAVFKWLEQRTLMLTCTQTCQVRNCSYRTVNDTEGGGKQCMVSLYLGLLTHIHCRVTKTNINPWKSTSMKEEFELVSCNKGQGKISVHAYQIFCIIRKCTKQVYFFSKYNKCFLA